SELETAVKAFNSSCIQRVVGCKCKLPSAIFVEQGRAFSKCTDAIIDQIYLGVKRSSYRQEKIALPPAVEADIKDDNARYVITQGESWLGNEVKKRTYIASVLVRRIHAVNLQHRKKDRLFLQPEFPIQCPELKAVGVADRAIKRGDQMLLVIEANQCSLLKGRGQTLAMIEAARVINKKLLASISTIHVICTDFQNWLFVQRESGVLREEFVSGGPRRRRVPAGHYPDLRVRVPPSTSFGIVPILSRLVALGYFRITVQVYGLLHL
ncbi:hypothetical protein PHMEG_00016640, partial [Phytophthora megakarya]